MDFQFTTDITGLPIAKCDTECEAFGDWLSNDISVDKTTIDALLNTLDSLVNKQINSYKFSGKIYYLVFADDEVELFLNNHRVTNSEFTEDDIPYGPEAGCGLVDFQQLLQEWRDFI
jgi:uncharacterized protein YacL (UPF0231 family)